MEGNSSKKECIGIVKQNDGEGLRYLLIRIFNLNKFFFQFDLRSHIIFLKSFRSASME